MKLSLQQKIRTVQGALSQDPMGMVAGELPEAGTSLQSTDELGSYGEFLQLADGGRCGSIDLWNIAELAENQYKLEGLVSKADHLCVGQVLYEPIFVRKSTGDAFIAHHPSLEKQATSLGPFEGFLDTVVFGPDYPKVIADGDQDEWFLLLRRLGYA